MYGVYKAILQERGIWEKVKQEEAILKWPELVGEKIASNCTAVRINKGILWIKVKDSVWLHHLSMMKVQIKEKFNKSLNKNKINDIYFFVGEIESVSKEEEKNDSSAAEKWVETVFDESEINDILNLIDDSSIKTKVRKILRNYDY